MARARNIKPGFFANEELAALPFETRLLFIGLWTLADREGRLEDRPKRIRAQVFPYDMELDVGRLLEQLAVAGFVIRYEVDGQRFAQVTNFAKHQVPHHKEVASNIPPPEGMPAVTKHAYDVSAALRAEIFKRDGGACLKCGSVEELSIDHIKPLSRGGDNSLQNLQTLCKRCNASKGDSTKDHRKNNVEPTLGQRNANDGASCLTDSLIPDSLIPDSDTPTEIPLHQASRKRSATTHGTRLPADWKPPEDLIAWAVTESPGIDIQRVIDSFTDYWRAKAGAAGRKADWDATFRNWVRREGSSGNGAHRHRENAVQRSERIEREQLAKLGYSDAIV